MAYNTSTDTLYIPFGFELAEQIWKPNLYIVESKFGYDNDIPQPNVMVYIYPNGTVGFNFRFVSFKIVHIFNC